MPRGVNRLRDRTYHWRRYDRTCISVMGPNFVNSESMYGADRMDPFKDAVNLI